MTQCICSQAVFKNDRIQCRLKVNGTEFSAVFGVYEDGRLMVVELDADPFEFRSQHRGESWDDYVAAKRNAFLEWRDDYEDIHAHCDFWSDAGLDAINERFPLLLAKLKNLDMPTGRNPILPKLHRKKKEDEEKTKKHMVRETKQQMKAIKDRKAKKTKQLSML